MSACRNRFFSPRLKTFSLNLGDGTSTSCVLGLNLSLDLMIKNTE